MIGPDLILEREWPELTYGDVIRVSYPKLGWSDLMGVVDDMGYSEDADEDEESPYDLIYLHTRNDDGTVSCRDLNLLDLSAQGARIERHPDFGMTREQLDEILSGGH